VLVGSLLRHVSMPQGGVAMFCGGDSLRFTGPNGIAYEWMGQEASLRAGERRTSLRLSDGVVDLASDEARLKYDEAVMTGLIPPNTLSFAEAGRLMALRDPRELEQEWSDLMSHSGKRADG